MTEPTTPAKRNRVIEAAMRLDNDQTLLVRMMALVVRIGARCLARIQVDGLEKIPRTGAVILAANHVSNMDPVALGAWITPALRRRRIHWLASGSSSTGRWSAGCVPTAASTRWSAALRTWMPTASPRASSRPAASS